MLVGRRYQLPDARCGHVPAIRGRRWGARVASVGNASRAVLLLRSYAFMGHAYGQTDRQQGKAPDMSDDLTDRELEERQCQCFAYCHLFCNGRSVVSSLCSPIYHPCGAQMGAWVVTYWRTSVAPYQTSVLPDQTDAIVRLGMEASERLLTEETSAPRPWVPRQRRICCP